MGSMGRACISREFSILAAGKTSPIVTWLRALARSEHERCGGAGVGVIGMCFTGGFALAMAADQHVLAPVLSQPSLPFPFTKKMKRSIDCSPADLDVVAGRCAAEGLKVLGLRFHGDKFSPPDRFEFLRERLGDGFVSVELDQSAGHPDSPLPFHHSVVTVDLVDEPGEPTRAALDQVLDLFRAKLLPA
jgi:dienelactone hydrolase